MVYALYFVLPYELDVVWLFFTFILVELRNKWIFAFWIIICPFSTQKCQCSALNLASELETCGFWNLRRVEDLDILTAYFV